MTAPTVQLHEVSPRDGLQNEPETLSTDAKVGLVERLVAAGLTDIEVTSFVRPTWIPQLADGPDLVPRLPRAEGVRYWGLVPNRVGLERALDAGLRHVATFMSASETHNKKNVNRTRRETLAGLKEVIAIAQDEGVLVRSYLSTAFGCPYEGAVDPAEVAALARDLLDTGSTTIALGDTTGMGGPRGVQTVLAACVAAGVPVERLAAHFHDTRGTALVNTYAAWQAGVRSFDGSIAGLGGCPYAPGAAGNAATEDLVQLFDSLGVRTGVDLQEVCAAGAWLAATLGRPLPGRMHRYHLGTGRAAQSRTA
jgi:hydroxymethylglutaryl-CoA lyase